MNSTSHIRRTYSNTSLLVLPPLGLSSIMADALSTAQGCRLFDMGRVGHYANFPDKSTYIWRAEDSLLLAADIGDTESRPRICYGSAKNWQVISHLPWKT